MWTVLLLQVWIKLSDSVDDCLGEVVWALNDVSGVLRSGWFPTHHFADGPPR